MTEAIVEERVAALEGAENVASANLHDASSDLQDLPEADDNRIVAERNEVVERFLPRLRKIAQRFAQTYRLPVADCVQEGSLGLIAAAARHGKGLTPGYANAAIRNAIIRFADKELESRGQTRAADQPTKELLRYVSIDPKTGERTEHEEYRDVQPVHFQRWAFDPQLDPYKPDAVESPEDYSGLEDGEMLKAAGRTLPPLWQKVLMLRYDKELTIRQVAMVLKLSKSEVARIEKEAVEELSKKLGQNPKLALYVSRPHGNPPIPFTDPRPQHQFFGPQTENAMRPGPAMPQSPVNE
jgi:RNA polymerase sigma factor (sigma-70 family)